MKPLGIDTLNAQSRQMIQNVCNGFKSLPDYQKYDIYISYAMEFSQSFISICIDDKDGNTIERIDFYPGFGCDGRIDSIVFNGMRMDQHYHHIKSSMRCFGLRVREINHEGTYVDVFLMPY